MPAHRHIVAEKAIVLVEAAGLSDSRKVLADFAAAGLIKTYALVRTTKPAGGSPETLRDAQIPANIWGRVVNSEQVDHAFSGGTVRLKGTTLKGGEPALELTGISFSEASLAKVLARYCEDQSVQRLVNETNTPQDTGEEVASPRPDAARRYANPIANKKAVEISLDAQMLSVNQAMQVTGLGRTKINDLMRDGTLERRKVGRRSLITVESVERITGKAS